MNKYKIYSKSGVDHGVFEGVDKIDALAAMHREAGYWTYYRPDTRLFAAGRVVFKSVEDEAVCGQVEDWDIVAVEAI